MRYFFDTEFRDTGSSIDLISIGMVSEDGREFYAVSTEFDFNAAMQDPWLRENVMAQLPSLDSPLWMPRRDIQVEVLRFLGFDVWPADAYLPMGCAWPDRAAEPPEIWAYYCQYDWVAFSQLFGPLIHRPRPLPMLCLDLQQAWIAAGRPEKPPKPEGEHDALVDARWNRDLYAVIQAARP